MLLLTLVLPIRMSLMISLIRAAGPRSIVLLAMPIAYGYGSFKAKSAGLPTAILSPYCSDSATADKRDVATGTGKAMLPSSPSRRFDARLGIAPL